MHYQTQITVAHLLDAALSFFVFLLINIFFSAWLKEENSITYLYNLEMCNDIRSVVTTLLRSASKCAMK